MKRIIFVLTIVFFAISGWIKSYFGSPSFDSILFHLSPGTVNTGDSSFLFSFIVICLVIPLGIYALLGWPRFKGVKRFFLNASVTIPFFIVGSLSFLYSLNIHTYLVGHISAEDEIEQLYIAPKALRVGEVRNLVVVYVESLEKTYSNKAIFGEDLLKPLTEFEAGIHFESIEQMPGGGWTIAGIVSSQCGIPLQSPLFIPKQAQNGNRVGEYIKRFLNGAKCLGDVLNEAGFYQVFMNGVDLEFAGVGSFFRTHKFDEVYGLRKLTQENPAAPTHRWGTTDDFLLKKAKGKFLKLYSSKKPFNLTVLTVDNHHPSGFLSPECRRRNAFNFTEKINCSSVLVRDFVDFIRSNDTDANTSVLVVGDHLAMKNDVHDLLVASDRKIFGMLSVPGYSFKKIQEKMTQFDLFPTMLFAAGLSSACRGGLGRLHPFFNENCTELTNEEFELIKSVSHKKSHMIGEMWK